MSKFKIEIPTDEGKLQFLGTGCTLLNLACSDRSRGALPKGSMVHIVGDSHSGKTIEALSSMAEATIDPNFDDYQLVYDDAEAANLFDVKKMFGQKLADRIMPPAKDEKTGEDRPSETVQEFQQNVIRHVKHKPTIYILDSFDAICSKEEVEKLQKIMDGKKEKGSYGMEKAKSVGQTLRMICRTLKRNGSILIIISQTRDDTDVMSFSTKTHSGGRALKFYAHIQYWLAPGQTIKRTVHGRERIVGRYAVAKVTKTKATGKVREVQFPIYYDYGIDDIGASIEWLISEGFWPKVKGGYDAGEFGIASEDKLMKMIEEKGHEQKLRKAVYKAWHVVEDSMKFNRKAKYS